MSHLKMIPEYKDDTERLSVYLNSNKKNNEFDIVY